MINKKLILSFAIITTFSILLIACGQVNSGGGTTTAYTISGTLTANTTEALTAYVVIAKTFVNNIIASQEATNLTYNFTTLESGTYYIYASTTIDPVYYGTYGWGGPPSIPTFTAIQLSGNRNNINFTLYEYSLPITF